MQWCKICILTRQRRRLPISNTIKNELWRLINSWLHYRKRLTTCRYMGLECIMVTLLICFGPKWEILNLHHTCFPWKYTNKLSEEGTEKTSKILWLRYRCSHQQHSDPESRVCIKLMSIRKKVGARNKEPIRPTERCSPVLIHTVNVSINLSCLTMKPSVPEEEPLRSKRIVNTRSTTKLRKGRRSKCAPLSPN